MTIISRIIIFISNDHLPFLLDNVLLFGIILLSLIIVTDLLFDERALFDNSTAVLNSCL